jgi:uncharacterized protein
MRSWIATLGFWFVAFSPALAGLDEGIEAYKRKDCAGADRELRPMAESGNALAQRFMGLLARFCGADTGEYFHWLANDLQRAVEQGGGNAEARLHVEYYWSLPEMLDTIAAAQWFAKAAEAGDPVSQLMLASYLDRGIENDVDHVRAMNWLLQAASCEQTRADYFLATHYRDGIGAAEDRHEAFQWFRTAAERGDSGAMAEVGRMYLQGDGVPVDYGEAFKWLRWSSGRNGMAQYYLGTMYRDGLSTSKDLVQAYVWFFRAKRAMFPIGIVATIQDAASEAWVSVSHELTPAQIKAATDLAMADDDITAATRYTGMPVPRLRSCRGGNALTRVDCCAQ